MKDITIVYGDGHPCKIGSASPDPLATSNC
jgi:hypothetical protein